MKYPQFIVVMRPTCKNANEAWQVPTGKLVDGETPIKYVDWNSLNEQEKLVATLALAKAKKMIS